MPTISRGGSGGSGLAMCKGSPNGPRPQWSHAAAANICDLTARASGGSLLPPTARRLSVMALDARIRELGSRHQSLEEAIQDELRRPASDDIRLQELKKQKLRLKEELETLRGQLH